MFDSLLGDLNSLDIKYHKKLNLSILEIISLPFILRTIVNLITCMLHTHHLYFGMINTSQIPLPLHLTNNKCNVTMSMSKRNGELRELEEGNG
jgi:hypothetical protein